MTESGLSALRPTAGVNGGCKRGLSANGACSEDHCGLVAREIRPEGRTMRADCSITTTTATTCAPPPSPP